MASAYRKAAFLAVGLANFTQQAYQKRAAHFTDDLTQLDMSGRVMCVTGANSGLGLAAARAFLQQHGTVHLICRDKQRGEAARDTLLAEYSTKHPTPPPSPVGGGRVQLHLVDLSSVAQTKAFCRQFVRSQQPLHVLVNNAGCMVHKRAVTGEGLEVNFATNVAATYTITEELLPVLRRCNTAEYVSRVITVSSGGMLTQDVQLDDLQSEKVAEGDATYIYAQNKRQQVVLTEAWQHRESQSSPSTASAPSAPCVVFQAMHPGWADTPGVQVAMPDLFERLKGKWRTADEGADTIGWLAMAPCNNRWPANGVAGLRGGEFWLDREVVSKTLPLGRYKGVGVQSVREELLKRVKALVDEIEPTEADMQRYAYLVQSSAAQSAASAEQSSASAPVSDNAPQAAERGAE